MLVVLVDEQPVLLGGVPARAHEHEATAKALAVEDELQLSGLDVDDRIVERLGLPRAPVPDDDVPRSVLTGGDDALEVAVFERMVLCPSGHASFQRAHRRPSRHGPADQDAADLQPEVVVEAARAMTLHDESPRLRLRRPGPLSARLGRAPEVALAPVAVKRHSRVSLAGRPSLPLI